MFVFALALAGQSAKAADDALFTLSGPVKVTRVSDGDSLRSGSLKIRLFGIDAPELRQQCQRDDGTDWACGQAARTALQALVGTVERLDCHLHDVDRYGRLVMQCHAGAVDIGAALIDQGLALAYRTYSTAYVGNEARAAADRRGMWEGSFTAPWDWRRR